MAEVPPAGGRYDEEALAPPAPARVLVADDDPDGQRVVASFLRAEGYAAEAVSSGEEALDWLEQHSADLVLLDVVMPGLDGLEVCRRLRADPRFQRLPVVLLTAHDAGAEQVVQGLEAGADEYVQKPIRRRLLAARVKNLLRLSSAERDRALVTQLAQAEKLAALGQIAAGVAHEINNPLGFMLSNVGSLGELVKDLDGALAAYRRSAEEGVRAELALQLPERLADLSALLQETHEGAERVRTIVRELRTFSRAGDELREPVDLAEVVASTLLLTEREVVARSQLEKALAPAVVGRARKARLHQVALNLLTNALQAVEAKPPGERRIAVATRQRGELAELVVSDTGCGIPAHLRARIFEPFFTTRPVGVGAGIGLAVCAAVAQEHGGRLEVQSEEGRGSVFTLALPSERDAS